VNGYISSKGAITNGQSRATGNAVHARNRTKTKHREKTIKYTATMKI